MPRYIDADVLLKELAFYADRPTKWAMDCVKGYALIPDPDVLKVVRCKDCKWFKGACLNPDMPICGDDATSFRPDDNFYCREGKRRETDG